MIKDNIHLIAGTDPIQLMDYCLADLAGIAKHMVSRLDERAFIIVPEALKADLEQRYLANYDVDGLMLAEVLSFNRLTHRIFSIAGGLATETISRLGKSLIIQRLIYDNFSEFKRFQRFAGLPGYSTELEKVLTDFKRFDLDQQTLADLAEIAPASLTKDKLGDFATLQKLYQDKMQELGFLDQDDNMDRLARLLQDERWSSELQFITKTRIWITGFADIRMFNQQELKILDILSQQVKELTITLCTDLNSTGSLRQELFEPGYQSFLQLKKLLPNAGLTLLKEEFSPERITLQNSFLTGTLQISNENKAEINQTYEQFTLVAAEDKRQEWAFIAGEIKRLLTENHYRKKDIGIAVCDNIRDLSIEKSVFREFGLETFLSDRIPIRQTALYRYLAGLFEISTNDFTLNDLLAFLRSGLAEPTEAEIDKFENICLEYGINNAAKIQRNKTYARIKRDEDQVWALDFKTNYLDLIFDYLKEMRRLRRGEEKSKHLLNWLSKDSFIEKLQAMIDNLREIGEEDISLSLARSWEQIIQLLEESIMLLGKSRISQKGFSEVILGTLSGQIPSSIPVGLDRIRVGSPLEMMYYDCKVLFIAGASHKYFPPEVSEEGFLHQTEINWIELNSEKALPNYKTNELLAGQVTSVLNLTIPKERVYLSVPSIDQTEWSEVFILLQNEITQNSEFSKKINLNSVILGNPLDPDQRWLTEARTKRYLLANQRAAKQALQQNIKRTQFVFSSDVDIYDTNFKLPQAKIFWQKALDQIQGKSSEDLTIDPLDQVRPHIKLESFLAGKILAKQDYYSASGLEKFQACPYQYFADYSLKLKERPIWDVDPRDRGTLIHSMMELALFNLNNKLSKISDPQLQKLEFEKWLKQIQTKSFYDDLYNKSIISTGVSSYADAAIAATQGRRIKRHVRAALWYNGTIIAPDGFFPEVFEWTFPPQNKTVEEGQETDSRYRASDSVSAVFQELNISPTDRHISLRGVIDRVDLDDSEHYRIYDYKTGNKKIDLNLIYLGLDLQLGLYQKIWQINHPGQKPDKIAYLQFNNQPWERSGAKYLFYPPGESLIERLIANDPIQEIKAKDSADLTVIGEHATNQAKQAVSKIHRGWVSPIPKAIQKDNLPCRYCQYQEMCRYDARLIEKRAEILQVPEIDIMEILTEEYINKNDLSDDDRSDEAKQEES